MKNIELTHVANGIYVCMNDRDCEQLMAHYGVYEQFNQQFLSNPTVCLVKNTTDGLALFVGYNGRVNPSDNGYQVLIAREFPVHFSVQLPMIFSFLDGLKIERSFLVNTDYLSPDIIKYIQNNLN